MWHEEICLKKCCDSDYTLLQTQEHCVDIAESLMQVELMLVKITETDNPVLAYAVRMELNVWIDIKKSYEEFVETLYSSRSSNWILMKR